MNKIGKLFTAFNKVTYYDEPHKYFIGNKELISVTKLIGKYKEDFDEEFWSVKKEYDFNVDQEEIKHGWKFINRVGTLKGSLIHDYAENLLNNKVFPYPQEKIETLFGYDPIKEQYFKTKNHVDNFYKENIKNLIPIKTELVVCDEEYGIGGMVDILFYNRKEKEYQIWDHKTNKEFSLESKTNLLFPINNLTESDIDVYSLQLELYKHIIEKNTGIKLGQSHLIWYSHLEPNYKIFKTKNVKKEIKTILVRKKIEVANCY